MDTRLRDSACLLSGDLPAAQVHKLQQLVPTLTHGEGALLSGFERYQQVHGVDHDPLNRSEYLLCVGR